MITINCLIVQIVQFVEDEIFTQQFIKSYIEYIHSNVKKAGWVCLASYSEMLHLSVYKKTNKKCNGIDSTLSFITHIKELFKSLRYHTRGLRHVRKCVSTDDAKQIATAMVSVTLDYCNSILYKTLKSNISKLHRLQNGLARVVSGTRKRDITLIL